MSGAPRKLVKYDNVQLYPFVMNPTLDNLISNADFSLDINYLKEDDVTEKLLTSKSQFFLLKKRK